MRAGSKLKAWTPGGSSTPMLTAEHLDTPLDFEGVVAAGSLLGTAAVMIMDETVCMVQIGLRLTEFYAHESCGKCTPCREGTYWMVQILARLEPGPGAAEDIDTLLDTCDNIFGRSFCALADGAVSPIVSGIKYFRDEFIASLRAAAGCPFAASARVHPRGGSALSHDRRTDDADRTGRARSGHADHRRHAGQRPQGHADHPGRRAARHPDPAVLRPPAARPGRRLPAVHRRGRGPAQAGRVLHHDRVAPTWS